MDRRSNIALTLPRKLLAVVGNESKDAFNKGMI